jgi:hypothetical protein
MHVTNPGTWANIVGFAQASGGMEIGISKGDGVSPLSDGEGSEDTEGEIVGTGTTAVFSLQTHFHGKKREADSLSQLLKRGGNENNLQ